MDACWLCGKDERIWDSDLCYDCWLWAYLNTLPDAAEEEIKAAYAEYREAVK